jgi:hypothetical protein
MAKSESYEIAIMQLSPTSINSFFSTNPFLLALYFKQPQSTFLRAID